MAIFLGNFGNADDICREFGIDQSELDGCDIILASYAFERYCCDAFVLFRKNGELFLANENACRGTGIKGQWRPDPITVEKLQSYLGNSMLGETSFGPALAKIVDDLAVSTNNTKGLTVKKITVYQASNGVQFDSEEACLAYEFGWELTDGVRRAADIGNDEALDVVAWLLDNYTVTLKSSE